MQTFQRDLERSLLMNLRTRHFYLGDIHTNFSRHGSNQNTQSRQLGMLRSTTSLRIILRMTKADWT